MTSVRLSEGVEEGAAKLLTQPKSDVLLLMDLQFTSQQWLDLLLWRVEKAIFSSK